MSFDMYIEYGRRNLEAMKNYMEIAMKVKEIVVKDFVNARIYVFGSVVEGRYTAVSDIDILVIVDVDVEEKQEIKVKVYREIDAPIELHVITFEEYEKWYKRFIGKIIEVP